MVNIGMLRAEILHEVELTDVAKWVERARTEGPDIGFDRLHLAWSGDS